MAKLAQCVLSLSHGNSTPERGFSVNKRLLVMHGYGTYDDSIIALGMVKDELLRVPGVLEFPIIRELLGSVLLGVSMKQIARLDSKQRMKKGRRENK